MKLKNKIVISAFILSLIHIMTMTTLGYNIFNMEYETIQISNWLAILIFIPTLILSSIWILVKSIIFLKKGNNYHILNITYYIFINIFFIITLFPSKYKMGVYTPTLLGMVWLFSLPVSILAFLWTLVIDLRKKTMNKTLIRFLFIIMAIIAIYMKAKKII